MSDDSKITQQDISHQAVRLGRAIDRLAPGTYVVILEKPPRDSGLDFSVTVHQVENSSRLAIRPYRTDQAQGG